MAKRRVKKRWLVFPQKPEYSTLGGSTASARRLCCVKRRHPLEQPQNFFTGGGRDRGLGFGEPRNIVYSVRDSKFFAS